jgi:hypothetical protein
LIEVASLHHLLLHQLELRLVHEDLGFSDFAEVLE